MGPHEDFHRTAPREAADPPPAASTAAGFIQGHRHRDHNDEGKGLRALGTLEFARTQDP